MKFSDRPSPQEAEKTIPEWQLRAEERKKRFTEHYGDGDPLAAETKPVVKTEPPPVPDHQNRANERLESPPPARPVKVSYKQFTTEFYFKKFIARSTSGLETPTKCPKRTGRSS